MPPPSLPDVLQLIAAVNAARSAGAATGTNAERQLDALFRTNETLAVYGTLAPGQRNHHMVRPLGGQWSRGMIEGDLYPTGWGAIIGYPAFRPRAGGATLMVNVLTTPSLPAAWPMLDEFEGPEYQRILVPVFTADEDRRLYTVANLYAATDVA